jgi:hypothetical protein
MFTSKLSRLCASGVLIPAMFIAPISVSRADQEVGFVSSVRGRPQFRNDSGHLAVISLMQQLAPGATVVLRTNESFAFCHEPMRKIFRIDGAGSVRIARNGIDSEGPTVVETGACYSGVPPSETGGVLLRSVVPPSAQK